MQDAWHALGRIRRRRYTAAMETIRFDAKYRRLAAAFLCLSLLAVGCSKQALVAQTKLGATVSACDALGNDGAASVLGGGVTVTPGPSVTQPDGSLFISNCTFSSNEARTVNILIRQGADLNAMRKQFGEARAAVKGLYAVEPQDVPGLGDAAFWVGGSADQLNVQMGGRWITVMVFALSTDDRLSIARNVASRVLSKF